MKYCVGEIDSYLDPIKQNGKIFHFDFSWFTRGWKIIYYSICYHLCMSGIDSLHHIYDVKKSNTFVMSLYK